MAFSRKWEFATYDPPVTLTCFSGAAGKCQEVFSLRPPAHLDLGCTPFPPPFRQRTRPSLLCTGACFHAMPPLSPCSGSLGTPSHQDGFAVGVETTLPGTTADPKTEGSGGRSEERPVGAVGVTICSPCLPNPWRLHLSRNTPFVPAPGVTIWERPTYNL